MSIVFALSYRYVLERAFITPWNLTVNKSYNGQGKNEAGIPCRMHRITRHIVLSTEILWTSFLPETDVSSISENKIIFELLVLRNPFIMRERSLYELLGKPHFLRFPSDFPFFILVRSKPPFYLSCGESILEKQLDTQPPRL